MNDYGIVIGFLWSILSTIYEWYENSVTARILKSIATFFGRLLDGSSIIKAFLRDGKLRAAWENSIFCILFVRLLALPARLATFIWSKIGVYFESSKILSCIGESFFGKLVILAIDKFEYVLGGSILLIAVTEHRLWNNSYGTLIILALMALFYLRAVRNKYQGFGIKYLDFSFIAFVVVIVMVQITSIAPKTSMRFFIFYLTGFLFTMLIVASMRTTKALNSMIEIMLVGISLTGVYGIIQQIIGVPADPSLVDQTLNTNLVGRIYSTMQNPNSYAEVLVMTIPFFAAIFFNATTIRRRLCILALAVPPILSLLATGSRTGWVSIAAAFFVYLFFKEKRLIPVFILLGVLAFPMLRFVQPAIYYRALTIFNPNDTSANYRDLIMEVVSPTFKQYWITGVGIGTGKPTDIFFRIIQNYPLRPTMYVYPPHTHVLYYQIWIEAGLLGIFTFLWMALRTIRNSMIAIFSKADEKASNIIMSGIAGLAGAAVFGLKEYIWFYPRTMIFFFITLGIVFAGIAIVKRKRETLT